MSRIGLTAVDDHAHQVIAVGHPPQVGRVQLQARTQLGLEVLPVLLGGRQAPALKSMFRILPEHGSVIIHMDLDPDLSNKQKKLEKP